MRWVEVTSVEELKLLVNFRNLLQSMRKEVLTQEINLSDNYSFFTSKANEYIFYLTELDGDIRMKKLGITKIHFTSKKKSKEWRDKISKEIHPDINHHPKSQDAMAKLNFIYSSMIGKE